MCPEMAPGQVTFIEHIEHMVDQQQWEDYYLISTDLPLHISLV